MPVRDPPAPGPSVAVSPGETVRGYEKLTDNGSTEVESRAVALPKEEPWVHEMQCSGEVYSVALSSDGATIVSADDSNKVTLWDAATGEKRREMECGGR
eukprot:scaffold11727_cov60-Phaeocystis_antarctica.AAC.1